jgi:glycosyltransferase involved in cell wall biosynthesis
MKPYIGKSYKILKMFKFSIITCTYNSSKYLESNIISVKNQNFNNFEHIFVDGFSTDTTVDIIKKYQLEFPDRVKFFQFKPEGISKAMNQGVEKSDGKYLIHLHSDDSFFDKNILSDVSKFLEESNYPDWIYGQINVMENNMLKGIFPTKQIWKKKEGDFIKSYILKFYNYIPHQAVFIKKTVFEKFGQFDEDLKVGMDPDLWLKIRYKTRWFFLNRIISNYSLRPEAQSSGLKNKEENKKNILKMKKKHLNNLELIISKFIDFIVDLKGNNYQK